MNCSLNMKQYIYFTSFISALNFANFSYNSENVFITWLEWFVVCSAQSAESSIVHLER